jgi:hypothetical protein
MPAPVPWLGRRRAHTLGEAARAKADRATQRPPAPVRPIQADLLIPDPHAHDCVDRELVQRNLARRCRRVDREPKIGHVVEGQSGRCDPEMEPPVGAGEPFEDVVDLEHEVGLPVAAIGIADLEPQPRKGVVMPGPGLEVGA